MPDVTATQQDPLWGGIADLLKKVSSIARAGGQTASNTPYGALLDAVAAMAEPAQQATEAKSWGTPFVNPEAATQETKGVPGFLDALSPGTADTAMNLAQLVPYGKIAAVAKALAGAKGVTGGGGALASIFGVRSVGGERIIAQANDLLAQGLSPEAVRKVTSVYASPADKLLRGEFSDKGAFIKQLGLDLADATRTMGRGSANYRLDEILHHPELFAKYPEFADTQVRFNPGTSSSAGIRAYEHGQRPYTMNIASRSWDALGGTASPKSLLTHVLHENTHLTQAAEGFANGGQPSLMYDQQTYEGAKQALADIEREIWSKGSNQNLELEKQAQINLLDKMKNAVGPTKQEAYMRLPGETEARMVPLRMDLSQTELQQRPPYYMYMDRTLQEQLLGNMGLRGVELPPR